MIARLFGDIPTPLRIGLAILAVLALAAPLVLDGYLLTVLILVLYLAYAGQAWNILMGFAGQLSLGHSLYVGVGAYVSATLFVKLGVPPLLGMIASVLVAMAFGAMIGYLAFRFGIGGVYFALLTIAFAEFTRIGFDHFNYVGGSGGLFLRVEQRDTIDLLNLRGAPAMFYYIVLALTVLALAVCRWLTTSRIGYYWLAIREDQDAAQALGINTFRYKMYAVLLSSGMTALAGVFFAFFYNNLFPGEIFAIGRSIEIILGPIIGGLGTLFGPILGAFVLTVLAESLRVLVGAMGLEVAGIKQVFYGFCLLAVILFLPNGIWPWLRDRVLLRRRDGGRS